MAERIKAASSSRVWIVVLGGRRGRPEIAAGRLMTRPEALRVAADMAEAYPNAVGTYDAAPVARRWKCRACGDVSRRSGACWRCSGETRAQAVRP